MCGQGVGTLGSAVQGWGHRKDVRKEKQSASALCLPRTGQVTLLDMDVPGRGVPDSWRPQPAREPCSLSAVGTRRISAWECTGQKGEGEAGARTVGKWRRWEGGKGSQAVLMLIPRG